MKTLAKDLFFIWFALWAMGCLLLSGCGEDHSVSKPKIADLSDLNRADCTIGGELGTLAFTTAEQKFPKAKFHSFNLCMDVYPALAAGKIDAMVFDRPTMEYAALNYPEFVILPENLAQGKISVGAPLKNTELMTKVNTFIAQYKRDGTYRQMYGRWVCTKNPAMPELPEAENPAGTLRVGVTGDNQPMSFVTEGGKLAGFDIEFALRLARSLNMKCQLIQMDYNALFAACASGKIDLAVANMDATEERRKNMLFSDYYIESPIAVMIRKKDYAVPRREESRITALEDLCGKRLGIMTGTTMDTLAAQKFQGSIPVYGNNVNDLAIMIKIGKIDALLMTEPESMMFLPKNPELTRIGPRLSNDECAFIFAKNEVELCAKFSREIRRMKQNGTLDELQRKWFVQGESHKEMPSLPDTSPRGELKYAVHPHTEPFCYLRDGKVVGYDVEIAERAAANLGYKLTPVVMDWGGYLASVASGKVRMGLGCTAITEERKQNILFSEPNYVSGIVVVAKKTKDTPVGITDLSQLAGKRVGIKTGTTMDAALKHHLPQSTPAYFNSFTDLPLALNTGKIDAFLMESPQFGPLQKKYPGMTALPQMLSCDEYAFIFARRNKNLCDEISRQIRNMKADGTLRKLDAYWFSGNGSASEVAIQPIPSPKGTLRVAVVPQMEPFAFMRDGKVVGYDFDVARIAAARIGYTTIPVIMDFTALLAAVETGKADFGASCITITEERKRMVLFSEPDYRGGIIAVVTVPRTETSSMVSFLKSIEESFKRTFLAENRWKLILNGLKTTVVITVFAAILGTLLAFPVCFLRRSKRWIPKWIGKFYVFVLQGTPILVILMILYYVIFAKSEIDAEFVAVIGFGLNFAAYAGEMLRTGIDAVPTGQLEAAKALSLTRFQTFRKVVFPQAVRQILPVYRGEFINMLKATSVVGYIAIQDLTKMSDIIRSRTYEAFFPLIATAAIYFATAWILVSILSYFEYRLKPGRRVRTAKGEAIK